MLGLVIAQAGFGGVLSGVRRGALVGGGACATPPEACSVQGGLSLCGGEGPPQRKARKQGSKALRAAGNARPWSEAVLPGSWDPGMVSEQEDREWRLFGEMDVVGVCAGWGVVGSGCSRGLWCEGHGRDVEKADMGCRPRGAAELTRDRSKGTPHMPARRQASEGAWGGSGHAPG